MKRLKNALSARCLNRKTGREASTVIRGLNDSHRDPIRGGLNHSREPRWNSVRAFAR
jgi:hypothetical protein